MNNLSVAKTLPGEESALGWWEHFFNASEAPRIVCRADGIAVHVNPQAAALFHIKRELAEGSFPLPPALGSPAGRKLSRILRQHPGRSELVHSVMVLREGSPHALMDLEITPLGDDHTLISFKDSGHRLRLESHVQRLITAIDATPDVFLVTDADLRITFVNPAFQSLTGYGLEEVLGRSDEFLRASFEQEKVRAYHEAVSRGREWMGEFVNVRRNGETYNVESTVSPISDIPGRFIGYVVCERDITARKNLQEALRIERDFVQSILHSLDGAIYSLDRDLRLTHANDGWRHLPAEHGGIRLSGAPEIGRPLLDHVPDPARRAELQAMFAEVLASSKAQDHHFHARDGRHWLVRISPWVNGAQMRGLICTIVDQSQYHELQNQLFQAQKMEIIGALAAGVAHDFNNLLQAIRGHASLILMRPALEPSLRNSLEKIDLAGARAAEITKQLLSFSRVSEERLVVLDLNRIIKEAGQMARRNLRSNVNIELKPAPKPVRVKMDSTRASQALLNLCVNAQDAMSDGGQLTLTNTTIELSAELASRHSLPAGTFYARCSVADTGCGIPADILPRIFEPFFTTKDKDKGTGLGLSIVQQVTKEAGGFIEVESAPGEGTTFHLYLPLAQEPLTPVDDPAQKPLAHGKGRVLVVDDVDLLREFALNFLQLTGLTVLTASSGQHALKVLEDSAEPVDLVFTDYSMPGMTGLELIEEVAARWPATRFVLASGFLNDATYKRIEQHQVSILAKPYDMHDAATAIMQKLAEKKNDPPDPGAHGGGHISL